MALKGNLRDFTITQLLNLINLAQKTGTLIIEGPGEAAWVSFREGKLAYVQIGQEDNSLAAVLYRANKLTAAQHRAIKERAGKMGDKELGLLLINANYVSQQDILASIQSYFLSVVNRLFTWAEGLFRFENNILPPEDKITVRIGLENLIMESSRKMREWEQLQDEIPSLDMALKFTNRPGANLRNVNLSVEEWRLVSYINPKNTMRQIARTVKLNDMEIRKIVYGLIQAGLVEVVRPEGALPVSFPARGGAPKANAGRKPTGAGQPTGAGGPTVVGGPTKDEQKSLINRIIQRIRAL